MRDDLFEPLRTDQPVAEPLPAAEVRRRGERLRRRRTAIQVVGAAAVVAFVAAGALTIADRSGGREPEQIQPPKQTQTQPPEAPRIRDDFPLGAGWPKAGGDIRRERPGRGIPANEWFYCGIGKVTGHGDRIGARQGDGSSGYARDLYTFGTTEAAGAAFARLKAGFSDCTSWKDENGGTYTGVFEDLDPRTFQFVGWSEAVFAGSVFVTQREKAIFVESAGTEGSTRQMAERVAIDQMDQVAPVTHLLCEFTTIGCDGVQEEDESHPSLATFPLTAGWPAGDTGSEKLDGPETYGMCGVTLDALPEPTGWRGELQSDRDATRMRQVFVFDTEMTAREFLDTVDRLSCRREQNEDASWRLGAVDRRELDRRDVLTVTQWFERDGQPVTGGVEATHVVRQGRAVLVSYLADQRTGRPGADETAAADLDELGDALAALEGLA